MQLLHILQPACRFRRNILCHLVESEVHVLHLGPQRRVLPEGVDDGGGGRFRRSAPRLSLVEFQGGLAFYFSDVEVDCVSSPPSEELNTFAEPPHAREALSAAPAARVPPQPSC